MATTVTYKYTDGSQSDLTTVNYHSETTSGLSEYFQARIPKYANITAATVVARVKTSLSSKADIKMYFADGETNDHRTTFLDQSQAVGNSFVSITGNMNGYWNSTTANAGKCSSQYKRLWVYMNATVLRRFTIDWITYNLTYESPKLTLSVSSSDTSMGTVSGGGTYDVTKSTQTKTISATPKPGYRFVKWQGYVNSTNATENVSFSDSDIAGNSMTWYFTAVFEPVSYVISFDGNGSTSGAVQNKSTVFGQSVTLTNTYRKYHYVSFDSAGGSACSRLFVEHDFKGFSDENAIVYGGTSYSGTQFDAPFYANTYADLYAAFGYDKYSLIQHYINNGIREGRSAVGSVRGVYPDGAEASSLTTVHNSYVSLKAQWIDKPVILPETQRTGYTFEGWYEDSGYTVRAGGAGDEYVPTANLTLFAKWDKNPVPVIQSVEINPNPANAKQGFIIAVGFLEP